MAEAYTQDVQVTDIVDLTTLFASMANVTAYVHNKGPGTLLISFSSSASAPIGGFVPLTPGNMTTGTAAHIWAKPMNSSCTLAMGTTDQ